MTDRPRDALGRVLPEGSADEYEAPDLDGLAPPDLGRLGLDLLRAGRAFAAHEAWEEAWKRQPDGSDASAYRALAQLAAGACHAQRGNPSGSARLLGRAEAALASAPDPPGVSLAEAQDAARGVVATGVPRRA